MGGGSSRRTCEEGLGHTNTKNSNNTRNPSVDLLDSASQASWGSYNPDVRAQTLSWSSELQSHSFEANQNQHPTKSADQDKLEGDQDNSTNAILDGSNLVREDKIEKKKPTHQVLQSRPLEARVEDFQQYLKVQSNRQSASNQLSPGAAMAHRSSFFTPSSAGGSMEIDGIMQASRASESGDHGDWPGPSKHMGDYSTSDGARGGTPKVSGPSGPCIRVSMEIAGGQHAPWSGNAGAPERMSMQVLAADENAPRQSDISSAGTIEELPPSLLTSIPPPPPPYPPVKPPNGMAANWSYAPAQPLEAKGKEATRVDVPSSTPAHHGIMQGVHKVDISSDQGSEISYPQSDGGKSKTVRSSFAAERRSMDVTRDESSLEMFSPLADDGSVSRMASDSLPAELRRRYHQLAVLPAEAPVPIMLLARLWGITNLSDTEAAASLMETKRILKMAILEDDTAWVMVSPFHLTRLRKKFEATMPQMHSRIVNLYRQGYHHLALVPDDHYFMQNIAHHLVEAGRLEELGEILRDPIWLETKLRSYGPGAVVSDFRRYLVTLDDPDIKLLLRSFQISASASLDHPNLYILKEQMLARLMIAAMGGSLGNWYEAARTECRLAVSHRRARNMPVHLLPRTPTLEQAGGLQRLILKGHTEGVRKVMLIPNGTEVVTASADGSIRLWDMEIGDCVLFMEEHEAAVTCIAITPDGQTLVSGSDDCMAIVYDLPSGVWKHKLKGHSKRVNAVAVDSQGRRAVSSSQDMTSRIWSLSKGTCLHVLTDYVGGQGFTWENWAGHHTVTISPDCRIVATVDGEYRIRIWKMETGELTDTLEGHTDWVVAVVFAGDSGKLVTASHDKTVRLWDLWTGVSDEVFTGHRGRINNLKVTPDGRKAVSVSDDSMAIMWDLDTRVKMREFQGHGAWINDAAITHNATKVITASGDELAVVWDVSSGEVLQVLKGHSGEINSVDVSYKGRFAITASEDGTARVWDLQAPAVFTPEHHQGKVTGAIVSPNSSYCVTIGEDNIALVWDVANATCKHMLQGHQTGVNWAFIVCDGQQLVTASGDRRVCIWNLESGECIRTLPEHKGSRMKSFAVSDDGRKAMIVLFDSTVSVWDLESMSCVGWLIRRGERDGVRVHSGGVNAVYICKNGTLALTISKDETARLWQIDTTECIMVLKGHEDVVTAACVKSDGTQCLTAGYDKTARLWDLITGECTMVLDHPSQVDHIAVDRKWQRAVSIAESTTAWLWDIKKGRCLGVLEGHTDEISGACFSQDGRFVATYSANSVVRIWTAHSGRLRAVYLGDSGFTTSQFSTQGQTDTLVAGDGHGVVHFLEFPTKDLSSVKNR